MQREHNVVAFDGVGMKMYIIVVAMGLSDAIMGARPMIWTSTMPHVKAH